MIILMGSVGSGKTEQGSRLQRRLKCPKISTSQLLREQHKWDSHIKEGRLVDDQEVISVLEPVLLQTQRESEEFILDGAPRSLAQAQWLVSLIASKQLRLTAVINLKVSDETVYKRLSKRGREDDRIEVIKKRLTDYHDITNPVLEFFNHSGIKVHEVNGELPQDEVEVQLIKILSL